jgi:hypothetical protein
MRSYGGSAPRLAVEQEIAEPGYLPFVVAEFNVLEDADALVRASPFQAVLEYRATPSSK